MSVSTVQWASIKNFQPSEFARPMDLDYSFLVLLDSVRQAYGAPLIVTADARTLAEETTLPNHAQPPESGLHVFIPASDIWCRAVDLRWIPDRVPFDKFLAAVYRVKGARPIELEFVPPPNPEAHIHFGWYRDPNHASTVEFA